MRHATVERLVDHVVSLETQPARGDVDAADLCRRLREPASERDVAYEPLLDRLLAEWVPRSFTSSGPAISPTFRAPGCIRAVSRGGRGRAHSRFPGHALTPTGVMAIRCKQFHLPDL